ncbi:MAG: M23 family metallopeptidase [Nitrospirota bacterium]|nr:MAG: M23 family metallopeptidase [Nitrospirota bacterium]
MKSSEDSYTIFLFRGARTNPLRLRLRKSLVRYSLMAGVCLLLLQGGFLIHYFFQRTQLSDLESIRKELSTSREQTSTFAVEIDGMKKRMVSLEALNRQLQTMFGLEADEVVESQDFSAAQGGVEFPYENVGSGTEMLSTSSPSPSPPPTEMDAPSSNHTQQIAEIASGLRWLNNHAEIEQLLLDELAGTATKRAEQLASTPSIWPVRGAITSKFGPRLSPFTGKKALHAGIDIGAPKGTRIFAPAAGKVAVAAFDARMGKFVRIDHGFGMETTYGHLSKIYVTYGTKVQRGDIIGLVGSTGKFSTGPHLHYQVAVNDRVVNPVQYILD